MVLNTSPEKHTMKLAKIIGVIAVLAIAAGAVWFFVIRDEPPEEVSLADAVSSLSTATPAGSSSGATTAPASTVAAGVTPAVGATAAATTANSGATSINGTWTIDTTAASFTGYRVKEELVRIGATTAVGRTSVLTATATIADNKLQSVTVTADLTQLKSDSTQRDGQLRNQAIETSKFPTATFTLTAPMDLPNGLAGGQQISTTVSGTLELHGVKKEISVPVQAQIVSNVLVIVGSTEIAFADYNITPPSAASVVSVEDKAIMELQIFLKKS